MSMKQCSKICTYCQCFCIYMHILIEHQPYYVLSCTKSMILSNRIIQYRLASSEEARLVESRDAVTAKLNSKCLAKFRKDIEEQERMMLKLQKIRYKPEMFYSSVFLPKVGMKYMYIVFSKVTFLRPINFLNFPSSLRPFPLSLCVPHLPFFPPSSSVSLPPSSSVSLPPSLPPSLFMSPTNNSSLKTCCRHIHLIWISQIYKCITTFYV